MSCFSLRILLMLAVFTGAAGTVFAHANFPLGQQVDLPGGEVHGSGRDDRGVLSFKGIPFAAPPVGDLRWRPPRPAPDWKGVVDATGFGPNCLQGFGARPTLENEAAAPPERSSEDCLTLNIWTPAQSSKQKKPVMVWIPGGGFQASASSQVNADGARLASKGVVVVSFNYRVGVYGFLAHPALDLEGTPSGDFGLQDQIAALKWVRSNIARFGGDSANVTIFGESAGSDSVSLLMTSPVARGLFQKAIGESGAFWESVHGSIPTHVEAEVRGKALADRLAHGDLTQLRAVPAEILSREVALRGGDPLIHGFSPSIDGFVIPAAPVEVFAAGQQADVPLLAGWNGSEGATFVRLAKPPANAVAFRRAAAEWLGEENLKRFFEVYPGSTDAEANTSFENLVGDTFIKEQTWEWLRLHQRTSTSPAYGFYFTLQTPYTPFSGHTAEIDYVFGTLKPHWMVPSDKPPAPRDAELSEQMMSYWSNFAKAGDPNGKELPNWPTYAGPGSEVMVFGSTTAAAPESGTERFRFIEGFRKNARLPDAWRTNVAIAR